MAIIRSLYIRERTRKDPYQAWGKFSYTNNRYKMPLWFYILITILCFIPIFNVLCTLVTIAVCIGVCTTKYTGREGWEKEEIRPYSKIFRALKFLNKKI